MEANNRNIPFDDQFNQKRRTSYDIEDSQTTDGTGRGDDEAGKEQESKNESAADINAKYRDNNKNDHYAGSYSAEARDSDLPYDEEPMTGERAMGPDDAALGEE